LHEGTYRVCVGGDGDPDSRIMLIGEAPGEREAESGRVFSGRAGQLLDLKLQDAGLDRDEVYVTNVVKCRPPDNSRPERGEWEACRIYLEREVKAIRPRFVLLMGNTALQAVARKSGITKQRGQRLTVRDPAWRGAFVMATIHPAYVLRNPGQDSVFTDDLRRFARHIRGERKAVKVGVKYVNTLRGLKELRGILQRAEVIAYDVETQHSPWHPEWKLLMLGLSVEGGASWVVPLNHPDSPFRRRWREVLGYLRPALDRDGVRLVAQNGKFDNLHLHAGGCPVRHSFDIMLASHLLDENRPKNLGFLSQSVLGADVYKGMVETKPEKILEEDIKKLALYNGYDTGYTRQIYNYLREELLAEPRTTRLFSKLMMPASHVVQEVEAAGMYVDEERLWERIVRIDGLIKKEVATLDEHNPTAGEDFNYNSTQQLGRWLFASESEGGLGLSPLETTKTGRPSTREAVLLHYHDHPAVRALLRYRTLELKWMNTYLLPWSTRLDSKSRLHTTYKLYGTVTGRLSGDLQQVPRARFIRSVIGAPPGWSFMVADFSQIELRIAAHCAREQNMLRAFDSGQDLHLLTAQRLSGKLPSDVTKEERKKAKAVNFGFLYGMYPKKFQSYAFESYQLDVSLAEAETARAQYFEQFPKLLDWHRRQERIVRELGHVVSPIGRVRHLPDVLSSDRAVQMEAIRQAINSPVQSMASDMMLFGMIQLKKVLDPREIFMVGTLHDGIFFEVRTDSVEKWAPIIKHTLENLPLKKAFGAELSVPIVADVEYGQYWGESNEKM
jgi:uracil-DNA glycosylase family 4